MSRGERFNMTEEFAEGDFNERMLEKRFLRTMETRSKQLGNSIGTSTGNCAEASD
jgi:hypothetical protein